MNRKDYGTINGVKPGWLYEEFCDIDVERLQKDLATMDEHLPWHDFQDADDSATEVAGALKEASDTRVEGCYKGATRGKKARIRDVAWEHRADSSYQEIRDKYKLMGGTYICMEARSCYNWHTDKTFAFQIPVISNDGCSLIFKLDDNVAHAFTPKLGKAYLINNMVRHTFINGGNIPRYHLLLLVRPKALLDPEYRPFLRSSGFPYRDYILSKDYVVY